MTLLLQLYPHFKVDGIDLDSFYISLSPTYQTYFDTINKRTDSLFSDTVFVEEFRNAGNPTQVTNSFYAFETEYYKYYYDTTGTINDSSFVLGDSIWYQDYHKVYTVFEVKNTIELARLITPYGEYSAGDHYPYTTMFDVTDYALLLQDTTEVALRFSGWQNGWLATLDFIFIEGTPPHTPKRVIHKYNGSFQYGVTTNPINPRLAPYDLKLNTDESYAQLDYTVTGHGADGGNCAEFCAKDYYVKVNGSTKYTKEVWKDDCGTNPIIHQNGTWVYNRANWCPGLPGYTDKHNLSPFLTGTTSDEIKVDFENYTKFGSGTPSYNISARIITFGPESFALDASVERIMAPNSDWLEYQSNPICGSPKVVIKNTGSAVLTSLRITYGPEGGVFSSYLWSGSLNFLESEVVELPKPRWERTADVFIVEVSEPNGGMDEYSSNNVLKSKFEAPKLIPNDFRVFYYTNSRSSTQNDLVISKYDGTEVYSHHNAQNNFKYEDTVSLESGCYVLKLTDSGNDGLNWNYNPSQGTGSLSLRKVESLVPYHLFQADFGSEINFQFMVGHALGIDDQSDADWNYLIYPNPSNGTIFIDGLGKVVQPTIDLFDQMGRRIKVDVTETGQGKWRLESKGLSYGMYTLRITGNNTVHTQKVLIQ